LYTTGSTSTPKGVEVAHRGLANLAAAQITAFEVSRQSRVLQFASLSVDAALAEVVVTLLAGATLCLPDAEARLGGVELLGYLERERVSVATLPPSVLLTLPQAAMPSLR